MTRLQFVALIFLAVLLAALPAHAQIYQAQMSYTTASVPFNFVVTDIDGVNHPLPAGDYSFTGLTPSILVLKGEGTSVMLGIADRMPAEEIKDSKLIFMKIGDEYFLHQIWTADHKHVHDLVHSGGVPEV